MKQESIIKPHLVKPMLERIVFDRLQTPTANTMINIKPEDFIDIKKVSEDVVKATLERRLAVTPSNIIKLSVTMSIDIPVDGIEFGKLDDPKEYIRSSQPVRILISYVSNMITNLTMNTILGPIVTPPNLQE